MRAPLAGGGPGPPQDAVGVVVLDKTIRVKAPPQRVFDALRPGLGLEPGPARPGDRFLHVMDALGVRWESTTVVDDVRPGESLAFRQLAGDYRTLRGRYEVEPDADGAKVRLRLEVDLPFVLPRLTTEDEIQRSWSRGVDGLLFGLKRRLEAA